MKHLEKFSVEKYLSNINKAAGEVENSNFLKICQIVKDALDIEWSKASEDMKAVQLDREKGAIIGYEKDTRYFKDKISFILANKKLLSEHYPPYYKNLTEAIFAELYGFSGITPWLYNWTDEYAASSSAKLLGDQLYCLINGQSVLQPQRIPKQRRMQLRQALLLAHPEQRMEKGINEVFLADGTRVTMFSEDRCKPDQDTIVFRKYILDAERLSFETLCNYGTFPKEVIPLFMSMIGCGFNVIFSGEMRSGKTTFLQSWVKNYDKSKEGTAVSTDPETDWTKILPGAPIMQLVADAQQLDEIAKPIRRSDSDYIILEEMRDASAYRMFLDIISIGTLSSAGTIHDRVAVNIPKKMADAIASTYGGNRDSIIANIFGNVHYVIELYQVPENRARKRLRGIVEFRYDPIEDRVSAHRICKYDPHSDTWKWKYDIGKDKEELTIGNEEPFNKFCETLSELAQANPLDEDTVVYPAYYTGNRNKSEEGR